MRIFIVRIGIQAKAVRSGKKCHQRFGTGTLLFCRHIVDFLLSINVCTETVAGRSLFTCKTNAPFSSTSIGKVLVSIESPFARISLQRR